MSCRECGGTCYSASVCRVIRQYLSTDLPRTARVMGADASRAVGRFLPAGPIGYRAATMPDAPLRSTRAAAVDDERAWLDR